MKKSVRIICLLLSLLMVLPTLAACSGDDSGNNKNNNNGQRPDTGDDENNFENLGYYDGEEIVISLSKYTSSEITMESYQYIQGPDQMTADSVQNKIYDRNVDVADAIGVEPRYVYTNLGYSEVMADVQNKVLAPSKNTPDLYIDQVYGMIRAQQSGFLMNVLKDGTNVDLTAKGWYTDYMDAYNFGSDTKLYLLAGDYFMDVIRFLNTVAVNLTMFQNLYPKQGGTKLLYDTVEQGNWTIDQMMTWCEDAFQDTGKVSGKADEDDRLGLISYNGGPAAMGWIPSVNVCAFNVDANGQYSVHTKTDERAVKVIDKLLALMGGTTGVLFAMSAPTNTANAVREIFIDGTALFTSGVLLSYLETTEYLNMEDDKCVIPFPKLEASDKYYVTAHDNARVGSILICTEKFKETTAWLQAMALTSTDVLDEYYNVALKFKYGTDLGTTKMLDIIYDSICASHWITATAIITTGGVTSSNNGSPLGFWYSGVSSLPASNTYVSLYTSVKSQYGTALNAFEKTFDDLD